MVVTKWRLNLISYLKQKVKAVIHAHDLKRMGMTQTQHDRAYDEGTNFRASRVRDMYPGYPYVFEKQYSEAFWGQFGEWEQGLNVMRVWCQANCQGKWRDDFHRVIKDYWGDWVCNELGGGDVLFFAFKSEQECMWFTLRWS